jgi:lipid A 4'-phosphatase
MKKAENMKNDVIWWLAVAIYFTPLFWLTDLDIMVSSIFIEDGEWIGENNLFAIFFYESIPILMRVSLVGSIAAICWFWFKKQSRYRNYATYLLLVLLIGPGLIANLILKDNWGRPRPEQTLELTGDKHYVPPLMFNGETSGKAKSFPSGHASAAFAMFAFWFMAAPGRRNKKIFWGVMTYGALVGLSRMAQGGHYLSDVIWAGLIVYATAWVLAQWLIVPMYRDSQL